MHGRLCAQYDSDTDDTIYDIPYRERGSILIQHGTRDSCVMQLAPLRTLLICNGCNHAQPFNRATCANPSPLLRTGLRADFCSVGARVSARSAVNSICDWLGFGFWLRMWMRSSVLDVDSSACLSACTYRPPWHSGFLIYYKLKGLEC